MQGPFGTQTFGEYWAADPSEGPVGGVMVPEAAAGGVVVFATTGGIAAFSTTGGSASPSETGGSVVALSAMGVLVEA